MSVMIKGVEMPSKCWSCPCCVDNGLIGRDREYFCSALDSDYEIENLEQRLSACPLNELPTPHGRLIDEEAIYNNVKSRCNNCHIRACAICGVTCILNDIRTAPTIIEAEV